MPTQHLAGRELQAFLDGELPLWRHIRARIHLAGCERCLHRLGQFDMDRDATGALLETLEIEPDLTEAWSRFVLLSGGRATAGRAWSGRTGWYAAGLATGVAAAAAALLGLGLPARARSHDVRAILELPGAGKVQTAADRALIERIQAQLKRGEVRLLDNRCCSDRDGEGPADDGMAVLATDHPGPSIVILYEDADRSGGLSSGDIIRLVSRGPQRPPATPAPKEQS
jgi:hypothetical protein